MELSNATKYQLCHYINKIKDFPSLSPENCQYRGEGNFGIVINLKKEGKVLKLVKNKVKDEVLKMAGGNLITHLEYLKEVVSPLLGRHLVDIPMLVPLSESNVRILNKLVEPHRPAHRRHKTVQESPTLGMLLPDYCTIPPALRMFPTVGPVLAVEIKPKQGFIPDLNSLPPGHELRSRVCRFCLMQSYKLEKGSIGERSGFCPIDLFSGCHQRMIFAVKQLIKTPQNNFRIFKDQSLVYGEDRRHRLQEELCMVLGEDGENQLAALVAQALCAPGGFHLESPLQEHHRAQHCHNSAAPPCPHGCQLPRGCVLHRMWAMERLGPEDVSSHLDSLCDLPPHGEGIDDDDKSREPVHLQPWSGYPQLAIPQHLWRWDQAPGESAGAFHSRKIWEFLFSLSLKDSSLMLVFQKLLPGSPTPGPPQHTVASGQHSFLFSVGLADLDLKHVCKVDKVHQDTWNMVQAYLRLQQQGSSSFSKA